MKLCTIITKARFLGFGGIHNVEKTFRIRGNDPLTEIGQTFTGSPSK